MRDQQNPFIIVACETTEGVAEYWQHSDGSKGPMCWDHGNLLCTLYSEAKARGAVSAMDEANRQYREYMAASARRVMAEWHGPDFEMPTPVAHLHSQLKTAAAS